MNYSQRSEAGLAVAELAIIIPFVFVLAVGSLDVHDSLRRHQFMSVIAREVGNMVYRECISASNGSQMNDCLAQRANDDVLVHVGGSAGLLPGTEIIVKVYRVNFSGTAPSQTAQAPALAGQYSSSAAKVSLYDNGAVRGLHSYLPQKGSIVTTEVFHTKQGYFAWFSRELYETTIF